MAGLVDVNVLVALVLSVHVHHDRAWRWLEEEGERDGWATCSLSELGAIRICAQVPTPQAPRTTANVILLLCAVSQGHALWPDLVSPATMAEVRDAQTPKQVSDRYLLGLARQNGGHVVTFDRGLAQAGGSDVRLLST